MQVPEGAISGPCDFAVEAIIAGQLELPEGTELVSAVYAISASRRLKKPVTIEIEHCVGIENEHHSEYLSFGIARCDQRPLPYTFTLLEDGMFLPKSRHGTVLRSSFSLLGVFKHTDQSRSPSSPEESSPVSDPPQASPIEGCDHPSDRPPTHQVETQISIGSTETPNSHVVHSSLSDDPDADSAVDMLLSPQGKFSEVYYTNSSLSWRAIIIII